MDFAPIPPARLFRRIAQQLAGLIADGTLAVGQRLPAERDLAARLHVSRPSLREALIALELQGLVAVRGGSGVVVVARPTAAPAAPRPAEPPGVFDILEARLVVEPEAAALAAQRATQAQQAAIATALAGLRAGIAAGRIEHDADRGFHAAVAAASGNAVLAGLVAAMWHDQAAPVPDRLARLAVTPARLRANLAEHEAVAAAIAAGDARVAARAMRRHLQAVRRNRLSALGRPD
jgi:GntR family transcriptional regulator, transcriptional repressor for pyruvate dehydrogenase complex